MSFLVWLIVYLGLYFGVAIPVFHIEGFAEMALAIIICYVVAEVVQAFFDVLTGRS